MTDHETVKTDIRVLSRSASYQFTLMDKVQGALGAARQRLFPRQILVAGPFAGEFGVELMEWQAWVRGRVPHYHEVHVITYPERDYLYPGCQMHPHQIPLEKAGYGYGQLTPRLMRQMAEAKARELGLRHYDILTPFHLCTQYHRRYLLPPRFVRLHEPPIGGESWDLAFHFRWVDKEGPDKTRNYPLDLADRLIALCAAEGYRICCIGHPRYSYCPPQVKDLRSADLRASVAAICSVKLLAGELSGPMHLAQLCGQPILIWAEGQWRIQACHRWNVFGVPTFVVAQDTFQPAPERAKQAIDEAMRQLRRG